MERILLEEVAPLLSRPLRETETAKADAALSMMWSVLSARYSLTSHEGEGEAVRQALIYVIATAMDRRLAKPNAFVAQESAGPFSVRWSNAATGGEWFLPSELRDLDGIFGRRGTSSYRTPAPAGVRYGNLSPIEEPRSVWPW